MSDNRKGGITTIRRRKKIRRIRQIGITKNERYERQRSDMEMKESHGIIFKINKLKLETRKEKVNHMDL